MLFAYLCNVKRKGYFFPQNNGSLVAPEMLGEKVACFKTITRR